MADEQTPTILDQWGITARELTDLVAANPSLRGILFGYVAEHQLSKIFQNDPRIEQHHKDDDHDRTRKGDLVVRYKGVDFVIELKSLQTNSITKQNDAWAGKAQCDGSDRRTVKFPDGSTIDTTCLLVGEFDVLAVNLFAFENTWRFVYCLNRDLPRSKFKKYTEVQRCQLLASLVPVSWPVCSPFVTDPFVLLDRLVDERKPH